MVNKRSLAIIFQYITDLEASHLIVGQDIFLPIKGAAIRHIGAGHRATEAWCQASACPIRYQPVVERARTGFHSRATCVVVRPLRLTLAQVSHALADADAIKG